MNIETVEKAQQCAALLIDDLRDCLKTCSPLESILILQKIEQAAQLNFGLLGILSATKEENQNKLF